MSALHKIFPFFLAGGSCVATFLAIYKLVLFLSMPQEVKVEKVWFYNFLDNATLTHEIISTVVADLLLLTLFILPHSLMKTEAIKTFFHRRGLSTCHRTIYCLISSSTLMVLIKYWVTAPGLIIWRVDVARDTRLWWLFVLIHAFAWIIIYGGSLIMDLLEILGAKQIYHEANNLAPPLLYKAIELRRLYGHVRHPSFICITIILWVVNILTLDRFVLNILMTLYMYLAWNPNAQDLQYHRSQFSRKKYELNLKIQS